LRDRSSVKGSLADSEQLVRFLAVAAPRSSDWLLALPITSCGLRLDDESVHVAVSMCLGINLCESHVCCGCSFEVDARDLHCFMCKHAPGRTAIHQSLNDVVSRAFPSAGIPDMKKPTGFVRGDGIAIVMLTSSSKTVCQHIMHVRQLSYCSVKLRSSSVQT